VLVVRVRHVSAEVSAMAVASFLAADCPIGQEVPGALAKPGQAIWPPRAVPQVIVDHSI
jgi:hypothetical protein